MARLIDAEALTETLERHKKDCNPDHFDGHETFIDKIDAHDSYGEWQFANGFNLGIVASIVETKYAPTIAEAKPTHSHWEKGTGYYRCSECGQAFPDIGYGFNFCPECGAKMGGDWEEPEINPCRGCTDYDGKGGCKSNGGCATRYCAYCGTEFTNADNND